jgi:hypothetical protein
MKTYDWSKYRHVARKELCWIAGWIQNNICGIEFANMARFTQWQSIEQVVRASKRNWEGENQSQRVGNPGCSSYLRATWR